MAACKTVQVEVYPAQGANTLSVVECVVTTAAVLLRGAYDIRREMQARTWPRGPAGQVREISYKTLGLIGFGAITRVTAGLVHAFGMAVVACEPFLVHDDPAWEGAVPIPLESLIKQADAISLHVPLTDDTRHLFNAETMAAMMPGAVLINAVHGDVLDKVALTNALQPGHIVGVALDVFEDEPLGETHPFAGVPNLILTPYIAGVTAEVNTRVSEMTALTVAYHLGLKG